MVRYLVVRALHERKGSVVVHGMAADGRTELRRECAYGCSHIVGQIWSGIGRSPRRSFAFQPKAKDTELSPKALDLKRQIAKKKAAAAAG
jgi:hypothetical protein